MEIANFNATSTGQLRVTQSCQSLLIKGNSYPSNAVVTASIARVTGENIDIYVEEALKNIIATVGNAEKLIKNYQDQVITEIPIAPASLILQDGDVLNFKVTGLPLASWIVSTFQAPFYTDSFIKMEKKVISKDLIEQTLNVEQYSNVCIPVGSVKSIVVFFVNGQSVEYDNTGLEALTVDYSGTTNIPSEDYPNITSVNQLVVPLEMVDRITVKKTQVSHVNLHFSIKPELDA